MKSKRVAMRRKLVVMDQRLYSSMVAMLEEAQTIIESGTSILRTNRYFKAANRYDDIDVELSMKGPKTPDAFDGWTVDFDEFVRKHGEEYGLVRVKSKKSMTKKVARKGRRS